MKINKEVIENLNQIDRFDNFVKHYPNFEGDLVDFLSLENITYSDKVWVVTKLFTKEQNVLWSIKCSYSVLNNYEKEFPNDNRPRKALEAAYQYVLNPCDITAESAAEAARVVWSAARSAESAWSAAESAAESAARSAMSAMSAGSAAESGEIEQENLNLLYMMETFEETQNEKHKSNSIVV